jgi:hypothetical protein
VEFQRTSGGTSIVAMLPRVLPREGKALCPYVRRALSCPPTSLADYTKLPYSRSVPAAGESKDSDGFRALKRRVLQAALEVVLKPFKDASYGYAVTAKCAMLKRAGRR